MKSVPFQITPVLVGHVGEALLLPFMMKWQVFGNFYSNVHHQISQLFASFALALHSLSLHISHMAGRVATLNLTWRRVSEPSTATHAGNQPLITTTTLGFRFTSLSGPCGSYRNPFFSPPHHPIKWERYRENSCARMTRTNPEVYQV